MAKQIKAPTPKQLVTLANSLVPSRNYIPVLGTALATSLPNAAVVDGWLQQMTYTTTDMDVLVRVTLPGSVDVEQLVNPKAFALALDKVTDFKLRKGFVDSTNVMPVLDNPVEDWPHGTIDGLRPQGKVVTRLTLPASDLVDVLTFVMPAVSTEETRYYLNGVYMHVITAKGLANARLNFVATDGNRLHLESLPLGKRREEAPGIIVPRVTVNLLLKALKLYPNAQVQIDWSETHLAFAVGSVLILSKVIDGTFPDYPRVIPELSDKAKPVKINMDGRCREALTQQIRLAAAQRERKPSQITAVVHEKRGVFVPQIGGEETKDVLCGVNASYVRDMIDDMPLTLHVTEAGDPIRVSYTGAASRLAVVMPMRV